MNRGKDEGKKRKYILEGRARIVLLLTLLTDPGLRPHLYLQITLVLDRTPREEDLAWHPAHPGILQELQEGRRRSSVPEEEADRGGPWGPPFAVYLNSLPKPSDLGRPALTPD